MSGNAMRVGRHGAFEKPLNGGGNRLALKTKEKAWLESNCVILECEVGLGPFEENLIIRSVGFKVVICKRKKSPRREVFRSSAGASVLYPPFLGSFA